MQVGNGGEAKVRGGQWEGLIMVAPSWRYTSETANMVSIVLVLGYGLLSLCVTDCLILFRLADILRGRKVLLVVEMETRHISCFLGGIMFENT